MFLIKIKEEEEDEEEDEDEEEEEEEEEEEKKKTPYVNLDDCVGSCEWSLSSQVIMMKIL